MVWKEDQYLPRLMFQGEDWLWKGARELIEVMEIFHVMIMMMLTHLYTFTHACENLHINWVNFIVCKLYLSKPDFKKN